MFKHCLPMQSLLIVLGMSDTYEAIVIFHVGWRGMVGWIDKSHIWPGSVRTRSIIHVKHVITKCWKGRAWATHWTYKNPSRATHKIFHQPCWAWCHTPLSTQATAYPTRNPINFITNILGFTTLQWRRNGCRGVSNHQSHNCKLNRLLRCRSENIKAPRHWPLCGEFTGDRWIPRPNGQ